MITINRNKEKEFLTEIATQLTELNFQEDTFNTHQKEKGIELVFTPEALEFYKERYKAVQSLYNTLIKNNK